jgi:hypothetical protein
MHGSGEKQVAHEERADTCVRARAVLALTAPVWLSGSEQQPLGADVAEARLPCFVNTRSVEFTIRHACAEHETDDATRSMHFLDAPPAVKGCRYQPQ